MFHMYDLTSKSGDEYEVIENQYVNYIEDSNKIERSEEYFGK